MSKTASMGPTGVLIVTFQVPAKVVIEFVFPSSLIETPLTLTGSRRDARLYPADVLRRSDFNGRLRSCYVELTILSLVRGSSAMRDGTKRQGTFDALRVRDFALLWSGQSVSSLGGGVFTVAWAMVELHIAHSPIELAYVLAPRPVKSVIFALLGGVLVERVSRRLDM